MVPISCLAPKVHRLDHYAPGLDWRRSCRRARFRRSPPLPCGWWECQILRCSNSSIAIARADEKLPLAAEARIVDRARIGVTLEP
jgi:hypothetical protein